MVDVANVMGARADGWWRDRAGAALRLCREVIALAGREPGPSGERPAAAWVLVLEGRARDAAASLQDWVLPDGDAPPGADWVPPPASEDEAPGPAPGSGPDGAGLGPDGAAPVRVVSAPASGDDAIVGVVAEVVARAAPDEGCLVVTADRELRQRCEELNASVVGPGWLLRLL